MSFIDIHGHYAWNIDDGIPSYEDARKALELARENRISAIVATPHVTPGVHTKDDIHDFIQRIDDLRMLATEYNIDILDGCELFLNHDYQKALDQNLFIPIENTQYVLVEFDVLFHMLFLNSCYHQSSFPYYIELSISLVLSFLSKYERSAL